MPKADCVCERRRSAGSGLSVCVRGEGVLEADCLCV